MFPYAIKQVSCIHLSIAVVPFRTTEVGLRKFPVIMDDEETAEEIFGSSAQAIVERPKLLAEYCEQVSENIYSASGC